MWPHRNYVSRAALVTLLVTSCGRPSDEGSSDSSCRMEFSTNQITSDGTQLSLNAPLSSECSSFLTQGSGGVTVKLSVEPASETALCPGTVALPGQKEIVTFRSEECSSEPFSQILAAPWKRPVTPSPTAVVVTLRPETGAAAPSQVTRVRLEFLSE